MKKTLSAGLLLGLCIAGCAAQAQSPKLQLPTVFADHMVLQQKEKVNCWGKANPGATITLQGSWGQQAKAIVHADGRWQTKLATPAAGGPFTLTVRTADTSITLQDVLIGEVWLASGQSNMDIPLRGWPPGDTILHSKAEIDAADYPTIRFLKVPFHIASQPIDSMGGSWKAVSPATAGDFSATAYFYARRLQQALHIPIGIIQSSIGGTPAEAWTSKGSLTQLGDFNAVIDQQNAGTVKLNSNSPTVLFNAMIHPFVPFTVRGVIWYQGESNVGRAAQYKKLFPLLIQDWRAQWGATLPFYYVQLAPFIYSAPDQHNQSQKLRDAQRYALALPKTGMVCTLDVGYIPTAHPPYKQVVGERLARFALANEYGQQQVASGPLYAQASAAGSTLVLRFSHTGGGLVAPQGALWGFEISGADKVFVPAQARIVQDKVVLTNADVLKPVYARYAWSDSSSASLFGGAGLPAGTFTTEE